VSRHCPAKVYTFFLKNYSKIIEEAYSNNSRLLLGAAALAGMSGSISRIDQIKAEIREILATRPSEREFSCRGAWLFF
jgi:hypothetical protein